MLRLRFISNNQQICCHLFNTFCSIFISCPNIRVIGTTLRLRLFQVTKFCLFLSWFLNSLSLFLVPSSTPTALWKIIPYSYFYQQVSLQYFTLINLQRNMSLAKQHCGMLIEGSLIITRVRKGFYRKFSLHKRACPNGIYLHWVKVR